MINFHQPGDVVTLTAPSGGVVSGRFYKIGSLLVCATADVAQTLPFEGKTTGVFRVTKVGSQAWTEGLIVYWDTGNARFTSTSGGNQQAGVALEAVGAGAGETTGLVRLDGIAR